MDSSEIDNLLLRIYPGPDQAVAEAQQNGSLRSFAYLITPEGSGVFALIDRPDLVVGYLSFSTDLLEPFGGWVRSALLPYLTPAERREVCCNVNGRNPRAAAFIRSLGFRLDMHGIKMAYRGDPLVIQAAPDWQVSGYQPGKAACYATLFDRAYGMIVEDKGGDPADLAQKLDDVAHNLERLDETCGVYAFWLKNTLAAACLVRGDYIRDLAVDPELQNRGLGSAVLAHVVNDRLARGYASVHLDVAVSNTGAQRFYARHNFIETGCFADHTYIQPENDFNSPG